MTTDTVLDTERPTIEYEHAQSPEEAHELIRQARVQGPIALGPHGPEVLTYELVRTVLRDDRFVMPKGMALAAQGITSGELWDISLKGLLSLDGVAHHRQRRLVSKAITTKAAERLRTTCADIIAQLVDNPASAGRCDVVADIARQYPIPIICAMLGTPPQDWHLFSDWADDIFKIFDWNVVNDEPDILRAWKELEAYLDDMVTHRREALTDDLLSDMIRAEVDGDRLAHDELLMLAATLLMAGSQAIEDVELAGVRFPAGTLVIANTAAANRDPAVYQDPDRFDITRKDAAGVLTFGGGIHYCLGANLARIELAEALTTMACRMPHMQIAGPVPWKSITGITGPASLPVEFTTRP
jgi:cytochrome P450